MSSLRQAMANSRTDDLAVFIPVKDVGIDLALIHITQRRCVTIQVKESVLYPKHRHFWFTIAERKIAAAKGIVDFFVFVLYELCQETGKFWPEPRYVVVPYDELLKRLEGKKLSKGKYHFYFKIQGDSVIEERDMPVDYPGNCLDNWNMIIKKVFRAETVICLAEAGCVSRESLNRLLHSHALRLPLSPGQELTRTLAAQLPLTKGQETPEIDYVDIPGLRFLIPKPTLHRIPGD